MAGAKETLCNVYDGRPFRREKMKPKKGKSGSEPSDEEWRYDVREPFLTMAVGTTIERFFDVARAGDLHSGFLPRFALVLPPDQPAETRPLGELTEAAERERAVLVQRLQELQEQVITLRVAPEVFERFNEYLAALEVEAREAPNPNLVAIIGGRVSWMAMHAAMALAAAEVPQRVMLPHLLRGIALAENWRHNAIRTLGALAPSRFERLAARVVQLVDQKARIARREVMRTLHLNRREIDDLQATLSERGEIIIEPQQGGSGPAAIWYRTAKPVTPVALVTGGISNGAREVPDSEDIEELVEWRA